MPFILDNFCHLFYYFCILYANCYALLRF